MLRRVQDYVRKLGKVASVESTVTTNPDASAVGVTGRIVFREPDAESVKQGAVSTGFLFKQADEALIQEGLSLWILLDRLDVAFDENSGLEKNALRALFKAYLDINHLENIDLKIFLRTDIWNRITSEGFREASHITDSITLRWESASILNLVIRRLLKNKDIVDAFDVNPETVLSDFEEQRNLFYRLFPAQVDTGPNKPSTFDWIYSRTADASNETMPREVIHLLSALREVQISRLEKGQASIGSEHLFEKVSFKEALPQVSEVRLERTLYAEYPTFRDYIERLRGEKAAQKLPSLRRLWELDDQKTSEIANQLVAIGFFERRGSRDEPTFWVPFLYRSALNLVQGTSDS